MKSIEVKVKDRILRAPQVVFDSIVNPEKLKAYFISRSSGPVSEGKEIIWYYDDVGIQLKVDILSVEINESIVFEWEASGIKSQVNISIYSEEDGSSIVRITEKEFSSDTKGIQRALQQTQGWTDFICSLKAYLYSGINLRSGRNHDSYK